MKTTVHRRLASLAGLLLLLLLVVATGVQAVQAATPQGTGATAGSSNISQTPPNQLQGLRSLALAQRHHGVVLSVTAVTAPAGTQGRGGVALAPVTPASGTQPATSTASSTTAWIVGTAAAVLIVGIAAWALIRRRRQPGEFASATYCTQHPDDSLCRAA